MSLLFPPLFLLVLQDADAALSLRHAWVCVVVVHASECKCMLYDRVQL